jgi:ornithine carbamoyltransferase
MVLTALQKASILVEALPYIRKFSGETVVIKYGGWAMVNEELEQGVMNDCILLKLEVVEEPAEAVKDADAIYTDIWASMGQEKEQEKRADAFQFYQINEELLKRANPGAVVLHCLPAHRGEEITDEVIDGPQSVVFDEAENRLHAHKAIMALLMG